MFTTDGPRYHYGLRTRGWQQEKEAKESSTAGIVGIYSVQHGVFPADPPRVPAASSVLFFTVKHPGRPSPGIPVCNVPLQAMILRLKSDVWIIIYLWYISPCLVSVYLAFLGYFDFILACFFGSDWYIFSITVSGPPRPRDTIASLHTVRVSFDCSPSIDYRDFAQVWRDSTHTARQQLWHFVCFCWVSFFHHYFFLLDFRSILAPLSPLLADTPPVNIPNFRIILDGNAVCPSWSMRM